MWSSTENVVWRAEMPGPGSSSPIALGDRVFVTCYSGYGLEPNAGDQKDLMRHVLSLDRKTGAIVWHKQFEPKLPEHPVFFSKAVTSVCGPEDDVPLDPRVTAQLDYEVELAYIVGRTAKNIDRADALSYIFGYTIVNDISARDLQSQHQQFFKGKSLDRSCPIGPWIVTADEIPDPSTLGLRLRLNEAFKAVSLRQPPQKPDVGAALYRGIRSGRVHVHRQAG